MAKKGIAMRPYCEDDHCTIYLGDVRDVLFAIWDDVNVMVTDPPYGMAFTSGIEGHHAGEVVAYDIDTTMRDDVLEIWGDQRPTLVMGRQSVRRRTRWEPWDGFYSPHNPAVDPTDQRHQNARTKSLPLGAIFQASA